MSKVAIEGNASGTGTFTIASPNSNTNRTLTLPDSTGTVVVSGTTPSLNGIAFPATQSASADVNTLDDYEEGTWTPTVTASAGTITSTTLTDFSYTKIGNTVRFSGFVKVTNVGTGVGSLILSLPFTPANDNWGAAGFEKDVVGYIVGIYGANNTMFLRKYDDSTVIVTNHGIRLGGVYQAA